MRLLALLVLVGCASTREPGPTPARAFYFWRTVLALSDAERAALTGVSRLYVRMFDVGADGALLGKITGTAPSGLDIVPVVFLANDVFKHPPPELAATVYTEMMARARALGATPQELQLDCDWSDATRDAYFAFLTELHRLANLPLSATIRLHQVKYRERTGVPPVQRGMLMFYNMGKFSADPTMRAIFDEASARKYLGRVDEYPLVLDVALPIWSWVVHLRVDRVVGLLQSTDPDEIAALDFAQRGAPDRYTVTRSAFLHGTLLRDGDVLKIEVTTPADTLAAAGMLGPHLPIAPRTVTLFDLSERNLARHAGSLDREFRALR